jgi:putative SOS response-associated peptidase YedK
MNDSQPRVTWQATSNDENSWPRSAGVDGMNVRDSRLHNYSPRWNAAPSQELLVIRRNHRTGEVSLDPLRWGLSYFGQTGMDAARRLHLRYVREGHPEQRTASLCHRRWHERARQPRAQLSAAVERGVELLVTGAITGLARWCWIRCAGA